MTGKIHDEVFGGESDAPGYFKQVKSLDYAEWSLNHTRGSNLFSLNCEGAPGNPIRFSGAA